MVAALLLFLIQLVLVETVIIPVIAEWPEEILLSSPKDDYVYVARQAVKEQRQPNHDRAMVYVLGGSTMREAFRRQDQELGHLYSTTKALSAGWLNLSSKSQLQQDTLTLLERLPLNTNTILLVGESPVRFAAATAPSSLPLRTSDPDITARWFTRFDIIYYRRWVAEWLQRRWPKKLTTRLSYRPHRYPHDMQEAHTATPHFKKSWSPVKDRFLEGVENNQVYFDRLLALARAAGARVIVIEQPRVDLLETLHAPIIERYNTMLQDTIRKNNCAYWDYRGELEFTREDFANHAHLNGFGKDKFEAWIMKKLAALP